MISDKDMDSVSIPLHISKFGGLNFCSFCKSKSSSCYTVRTNIGTRIICNHCKEKVEKHYSLKPERETFSNNKNILSGGAPYTNRHKY
jgi:hypothetical protein